MDSTLSPKLKLSAKQQSLNSSSVDKNLQNDETSLHIGRITDAPVSLHKEFTEMKQDEDGVIVNQIVTPSYPLTPFDDPTPSHALRRMYEIQKVSMTSLSTFFFDLTNLFAESSLKRVLTMFSLMRFDVRVKLVINAVPQQYGFIQFSAMPFVEGGSTSTDPYFHPGSANPVLLDISSCQTMEKIFPFHFPGQYLPLTPSSAPGSQFNVAAQMWHFRLGAFMSTVDSTVDTSVPVSIYMGLENVEVAGPKPRTYYEQSGLNTNGAFRNMAAGASAAAAVGGAAYSQFKQGLETYNAVKKTGTEAFAAASEIKTTFDSVVRNETETFYEAYKDEDISPDELKTAEIGGQTGVKYSPFGDMSTALPDFQMNYLTLNSKSSICDASWAGESSPGNHRITDIVTKPAVVGWHELIEGAIYASRVDPSMMLNNVTAVSTNPIGFQKIPTYMCYLSRCFKFWRGGIKVMLSFFSSPLITARIRICLKYLCDYFDVTVFNDAPRIGYNDIGDIYSEVITVRGTENFEITIPYLAHQPWTPCYLEVAGAGNDIDPSHYTFGYLSVYVEEIVKGAGSSVPSVWMASTIAAAEDFEFRQLIAITPDDTNPGLRKQQPVQKPTTATILPSSRVVYTPQMDMNIEFQRPFRNPFGREFAPTKFATGTDRVKTIEHVLGRFDFAGSSATVAFGDTLDTEYPILPSVSTGATQISNGTWVMALFRWWRGSRRVKIHITKNSASTNPDAAYWVRNQNPYPAIAVATPTFDFEVANGATGLVPSLWQNAEVEVPFYYPYMAQYHSPYGTNLPTVQPGVPGIGIDSDTSGDDAIASIKWYIAAGRDMQIFYLLPVPEMARWPR